MLRFGILFLALFSSVWATNFARIYLDEGLEAVKIKLDEELASKDFWLNEIKEDNVSLGYYTNEVAIVLTNKGDKTFKVYFYKDGNLESRFEQNNVLTGLMGDKKIEGDLKTPIGFYELGKKFDPGDTYYGPFAFATTYPNLYDKAQGKTGGGIWIHGYPLDGTRIDEYKTRGCIALQNDLLVDFYSIVKDQKRVYAMTEETQIVRTNTDEIASILASLFAWKNSWSANDIKTYLDFYDKKLFKSYDKRSFKEFAASKTMIFSRNEEKSIKFSNINISPYPNAKNEKIFRVSFYEDYYTAKYQFKGNKFLYIRLDGDKMQILTEQ